MDSAAETEDEQLINPILPEYIPRLSPEFIKLYNEYDAKALHSHQVPIEEYRAHPEKYTLTTGIGPAPGVYKSSIQEIRVPIRDSHDRSIKICVYESRVNFHAARRPVYINYHGGGWVFGGLATDKSFCSKICNSVACVVVDVDYSLAPEHPWPAQLEDSWAALQWVREHADDLRINPEEIVIGGTSAGGHLAAVLAQRCRAVDIPLKAQFLVVPVTDLHALDEDWNIPPDCPYDSYFENISAPRLPLERIQFFMKQLLGEKMPNPVPEAHAQLLPADVELSPIRADSLKGLAPAAVFTADVDILRDQGEAYAKKMVDNGVPVRLKRYMGVPHPFTHMDAGLAEARQFVEDYCDALQTVFNSRL